MIFDWNDLRYFLSVARAGRLTAAARTIGSDHATVSRRITALEGRLSAQLFERSPRGYALTDAGERLLRHAEQIESVAARVHDDIAGERYALSGSVRIGTPDGFGAFFLAPRLGDFATAHPELEVQLVATPQVFSLSKREADIVITLSRPEKGRLISRKLTDYTLHLYGAPSYLKTHPLTDKSQLREHLMIGYIPELIFTPELDYLSLVVGDLVPQFSSSNLFGQLRAIQAGKGIGILPDFMARGAPELVPLLPDEIEITRSYWLQTHQDLRESARVRTAMRFIAEQVSEAKAEFLPEKLGQPTA
ncbi:LysR family transcriptional regulator [Thioclava dalianensis]|uniref:LysR family transcriptional regulator n=1 Tax=Thioclava dalianensis TaxID=1185766 RepID=A0A074THG9_9RHOB|nr:LysR family transcriptional regulator [Thioclava dalianensis]KEP69600.1 LysR family transcriptional regulator [Thioclava dalianensis]SFN15342.1 DNA-binding transcriptional regulator, LysR family [Thioclava dalianensis]